LITHSIIIPTAGRPVAIKQAVHSVLEQDLEARNAELIVVDNNTDEQLATDLSTFCKEWGDQLRYVREPSPGLGAARHRGAAESNGEWLTFLDDDVEVSDTWLPALHRAFSESDVVMVGGASIPKFTASIPAWFWDFMSPTPYGGWMNPWLSLLDIEHDVENIDPNYIWGLNFSIRKKMLFELGGFHPDLVPLQLQRWQGDGETGLTMKVKKEGLRANYVQGALLHHLCGPDRLTVEYFQKRAFYQGVCNSFTQIRYGKQNQSDNLSGYFRLRRMTGRLLRKIRPKTSLWSNDVKIVRQLTQKAERDGWLFHQNEVRNDPALLAWVTRQDYFDTDLREFEIKQG
jgi:glucosyl-dolichyl phosphate glucuronosyltransferase